MRDITRHYGNLTADERLKVVIDAFARGDWEEVEKLRDTCPKVQYVAQLDFAYTGKYSKLQTMVLFHVIFFWSNQSAMFATKNDDVLVQSVENLFVIQEAWTRFCTHAGFDADTVLMAFGFPLVNIPRGDMKLNEAMTDETYRAYVQMWEGG